MAIENVKVFGDVEINRTNIIRVSANKMDRGQMALDIRRWYLNDDDEYAPSGKGISIPVKAMGDLGKIIQAALKDPVFKEG